MSETVPTGMHAGTHLTGLSADLQGPERAPCQESAETQDGGGDPDGPQQEISGPTTSDSLIFAPKPGRLRCLSGPSASLQGPPSCVWAIRRLQGASTRNFGGVAA